MAHPPIVTRAILTITTTPTIPIIAALVSQPIASHATTPTVGMTSISIMMDPGFRYTAEATATNGTIVPIAIPTQTTFRSLLALTAMSTAAPMRMNSITMCGTIATQATPAMNAIRTEEPAKA